MGSFQSALFVAVVASVFGAIAIFVEDLPSIVRGILAVIGLVCLLWVASLIRQGIRYLSSGKDWRVEVTERKVSWQSPVPETMASFEVPLSDILTLRHVITKLGSRNAGRRHDYTIELRTNDIIDVSDQISGIAPEKVFEAMQERGVPLVEEFVHTKEQFRQKRNEKRARKREAKARHRLQTSSVVSGR